MDTLKALVLFAIFITFALSAIFVKQKYFTSFPARKDIERSKNDTLSSGFSEFTESLESTFSQMRDGGQAIKGFLENISLKQDDIRLSPQEVELIREKLLERDIKQKSMMAMAERIEGNIPNRGWQISGQVFDVLPGVRIADFSIRIVGITECEQNVFSKKVLHFFPITSENEILANVASLNKEDFSPRCIPKFYATTTDYFILDGCSNDFQCEDADEMNKALRATFKNL